MKKRAICVLLAALTVLSVILPALAIEPAKNVDTPASVNAVTSAADNAQAEPKSGVYLDGIPQAVEYEILDGTTYVTVSSFVSMADPQAVVEEENGVVTVSSARVEQIIDAEGNTANVAQETLSMTVSTKVPYIVANGRYLYAKGSIVTVNGRVAAPAGMLAQVFNLNVGYDASAYAVLLSHGQGRSAYIQSGDSYYDADSLFWLSRIIYTESGNQILDGKIAVGNVVMNRVNSPQFPNNIHDVLNQKNQFRPTSGLSKITPTSECVVAAKLVLDGAVVLPTALFFNTKGLVCYASKYRPYVTTIGNHDFYA